MNDEAIIDHLADGPLHRFAAWPNPDVPTVAIGLYTIWRGDVFIYIGMAGKTALSNLSVKQEVGRPSGLLSRLESHASGKRSGDEFCDFVTDQILAAAGHPVSDDFVRDYVCQHLSYCYFAFEGLTAEEQQQAYRIERRIQAGHTRLGKPLLKYK